MKRQHHLLLFLLAVLPLFLSTRLYEGTVAEKIFVIDNNSELNLRGSSNVNKFTCLCLCYEKNRRHRFRLEEAPGAAYEFAQTSLKLTTHDLDCGHKGINKDLYQTLKAESYPHITIELLRARPANAVPVSTKAEGWFNIRAITAITIAGVRREVPMDIRGQRLGDQSFRFVGAKDLLMTDFQIKPPTALLGLVKVDDKITINLDLTILLMDV